MIVYFDTSAFVPLLVDEPGSAFCRRLWDDAERVVTTRLLYVEASAAVAMAWRLDRLTGRARRGALRILDRLWTEVELVEIDEDLVRRAGELAHVCRLHGYDAVHCAAAEQLRDGDLVVAGGDRKLLDAWASLGLAVADVNEPDVQA